MELRKSESPIYERHPFLHHYTGWSGLEGIIRHNTIWATQYDCLNDSTEVAHLRPFLVDALAPRLTAIERERAKRSFKARRRNQRVGGPANAARILAGNFIDAFYEVALKGTPPYHIAFAIPYIASFCGHEKSATYEQQNGLLSQWRAYGGGERYAVVFDTRQLYDLVNIEEGQYRHTWMHFSSVIYDNEKLDFRIEFAPLIEQLEVAFRRKDGPSGEGIDQAREAIKEFFLGTTRFKHRAFREESEVRIVAWPASRKLAAALDAAAPPGSQDSRKMRKIEYRMRNDGSNNNIPYVALFEGLEAQLPIVRVIVGPNLNQDLLFQKARKFVGSKIEVMRSETPFVG